MIVFKSKGAHLKDKGTMADLSKKLELFIGELNDEQVVTLNSLVKTKEVDVIIIPSGYLEDIEDILKQVREIKDMDLESEEPLVIEIE